MWKFFVLISLSVLSCATLGQTQKDRLLISNTSNRIYAIILKDTKDSTQDDGLENTEAYEDFVYHTKELGKHVHVPVKMFIASSVFLASRELISRDSGSFIYVFVRKNEKPSKIIYGVDTWESLKVQIENYFEKK